MSKCVSNPSLSIESVYVYSPTRPWSMLAHTQSERWSVQSMPMYVFLSIHTDTALVAYPFLSTPYPLNFRITYFTITLMSLKHNFLRYYCRKIVPGTIVPIRGKKSKTFLGIAKRTNQWHQVKSNERMGMFLFYSRVGTEDKWMCECMMITDMRACPAFSSPCM